MTSLKCIFLNVNSLVSRQKRHYLELFVREHRPDVLLIAETKLSARHTYGLQGYTVFRQDRRGGSAGGGTAICLTDRLSGERLASDFGNVEATVVRIKGTGGRSVVAMSLYLRPTEALGVGSLDAVEAVIGTDEAVIGADLNAKHGSWGGVQMNTRGRALYEWLLSCPSLLVRPTVGPTRCAMGTGSYIDMILTTVGIRPTEGAMRRGGLRIVDFESDHKAVVLEATTIGLRAGERVEVYDFNRMDVRAFNRKLAERLGSELLPRDRNVLPAEIDEAVGKLSSAINQTMVETIRKVTPKRDGLPELPPDILDLIRQKKTLRRRVHRTLDPQGYTTAKAIIKRMNKLIGERIARFEEEYYLRRLQAISADKDMYRKVKGLSGALRRRGIDDLVDSGGRRAVADREKAEILASEFARIQGTAVAGYAPDDDEEPLAPMVDFGTDYFADGTVIPGSTAVPLRLVKVEEIGAYLKRLNNKKSCGEDGIPNFVLKRAGRGAWSALTLIFNHSLNVGYFPKEWKVSKVVAVPKPGKDPTDPGGYRPISLLSNVGKLFEIVILERLNEHLDTEAVLGDCQFGFRRQTSTVHALMTLTDRVTRRLNDRCATIAVSLDFQKAFDTVWQMGIVEKMRTFGFDRYVVALVGEYLRGRSFAVALGTVRSDTRAVMAGVPQGSVLGPVLYNIYLADIPLPQGGELLLIYADDIMVASTHASARIAERNLTRYLETLRIYFDRWRLSLNVEKCRTIMFKGIKKRIFKNARGYIPRVTIGGEVIANARVLKYLGIVFQEDMTYTRHVDHVMAKGRMAFQALYSALAGRGGLSRRVKLAIYRQIVRPSMSYGFPIWFSISSHQMERIRMLERRILRYCLDLRCRMDEEGHWIRPSCRRIYELSALGRIDVFMTRTALDQLSKCSSHPNEMVRGCAVSDETFDRYIRQGAYLPPASLLNMSENGKLYDENGRLLFYHRRFRTYGFDDLVYRTSQ